MKTCSKCKEEKDLREFYPSKGGVGGKKSICKACCLALSAATRAKTKSCPEAYKRFQQHERGKAYKRKYGVTIDDFDAQLSHQNGRCAICGTTEPGGHGGRFHIDHDHTTGRVRGLLCHMCNTAIGKLNDDPLLLMKAANYLLNPPSIL